MSCQGKLWELGDQVTNKQQSRARSNSQAPAFRKTSRLLSIPESAPRLGLTEKGLWAFVARRNIESVKVGRLRKIPEHAIDEFIAKNTVPALE